MKTYYSTFFLLFFKMELKDLLTAYSCSVRNQPNILIKPYTYQNFKVDFFENKASNKKNLCQSFSYFLAQNNSLSGYTTIIAPLYILDFRFYKQITLFFYFSPLKVRYHVAVSTKLMFALSCLSLDYIIYSFSFLLLSRIY